MKLKNKQAATKRFSFSAKGKAKHRMVGQAHFNGRATGNEIRRKRPARITDPSDTQRVTDLIPYPT